MKELTSTELNNVSGGLLGLGAVFGGVGAAMGTAIGSIVDKGCASGGFDTDFRDAGMKLGGGIGAIVGLSPVLATKGIYAGVNGIVDNANSIKAQKAAR